MAKVQKSRHDNPPKQPVQTICRTKLEQQEAQVQSYLEKNSASEGIYSPFEQKRGLKDTKVLKKTFSLEDLLLGI